MDKLPFINILLSSESVRVHAHINSVHARARIVVFGLGAVRGCWWTHKLTQVSCCKDTHVFFDRRPQLDMKVTVHGHLCPRTTAESRRTSGYFTCEHSWRCWRVCGRPPGRWGRRTGSRCSPPGLPASPGRRWAAAAGGAGSSPTQSS